MNFYNNLMQAPVWRVVRRMLVAAIAASLAVLIGKVGLNPLTIIDNSFLLQAGDWKAILEAGVGTALVMGIDKLQREILAQPSQDNS